MSHVDVVMIIALFVLATTGDPGFGGPTLALGFSIASGAQAEPKSDPQVTDQSTIVVTGERPSRDAINNFVRSLTPVASNAQISRLERSVCPVTFGLPEVQAAAVARRMRLVARSVGLSTAKEGCTPNVLVIATFDKRALLELVRKERPDYLATLSREQVADLERAPGPALAWQLADSEVNADGTEMPWDPKTGWVINSTVVHASRLTVTARPRFYAAIVVVERHSLEGLTTTQLADYAAMRAYTGADPARLGSSSAPTILHVLDAPMGTAVPVTMTSWDFGFLHGFYASRRDVRTASQRSSIADTMGKDIRHGGAER